MRFLELNEIWEWCVERGVALDEERRIPNTGYVTITREFFESADATSDDGAIVGSMIASIGEWDDCLLWVTDWGIWSSTENWPAYYAARGALGEKRDLATAPGLLVARGETSVLRNFLLLAVQNGWDAHVMAASGGAATTYSLFTSHDEWIQLRMRVSPQ